jgi:hypothetical protein
MNSEVFDCIFLFKNLPGGTWGLMIGLVYRGLGYEGVKLREG